MPDDGKRKKAVMQQSFPLRLIHYGGFDKIKAAILYALILALERSAAHGGSRHEAKSVSTEYDGVCTVKKARPQQREHAVMSMNYTMQINCISPFFSPGGSMTCRAKIVVFCGFPVRAGAAILLPVKGVE